MDEELFDEMELPEPVLTDPDGTMNQTITTRTGIHAQDQISNASHLNINTNNNQKKNAHRVTRLVPFAQMKELIDAKRYYGYEKDYVFPGGIIICL